MLWPFNRLSWLKNREKDIMAAPDNDKQPSSQQKYESAEIYHHRPTHPTQQSGIPFGWALSFFCCFCVVILAAVYIGHTLTVNGQKQVQQIQPVQPLQPQYQLPQPSEKRTEADRKTDANINIIAESMQKITSNTNDITKVVDSKIISVDSKINSIDKRFEELQMAIKEVSKNINNIKEPNVKLDEINKNLTALNNVKNLITKDDISLLNKNLSTKDDLAGMSDKNNKMLNTLNQNIIELAHVLKDKVKLPDEIKINSSLGEEFPSKK